MKETERQNGWLEKKQNEMKNKQKWGEEMGADQS